MEEKIKVTGFVTVKVVEVSTGKTLRVFKGKNLIVNLGLNKVCTQFGAAPSATGYISSVDFGTSNTAATLADTAITAPFNKAITTVTYPGTGQVQYNFSLEAAEHNGAAINEFGLKCADGDLFARKVVGPSQTINKTSAIRLDCQWLLTFN